MGTLVSMDKLPRLPEAPPKVPTTPIQKRIARPRLFVAAAVALVALIVVMVNSDLPATQLLPLAAGLYSVALWLGVFGLVKKPGKVGILVALGATVWAFLCTALWLRPLI